MSTTTFVNSLPLTSMRLVRPPRAVRKLATAIVVLFLALPVVLLVAPWQQNVPASGRVTAVNPLDRTQIQHEMRTAFTAWDRRGGQVAPNVSGQFAGAYIAVPRAKEHARQLLAQAIDCVGAGGFIAADGQKTDGVDSLLKDIRKRVPVSGPVSKAHGKIFWFQAEPAAFADWAPKDALIDGRFHVAPGVFSVDGIDPASEILADSLPGKLGAHVADLGAGWGYLSAAILQRTDVVSVDLVEADRTALNCAERNITDARARFHWADATVWESSRKLDAVVMNPPFHSGRTADPDLGKAFIAAAARLLGMTRDQVRYRMQKMGLLGKSKNAS